MKPPLPFGSAGRSPLACVTMAYNEPDFLPIWARHYAGQVGAAHCYVIDHGTDDGSTDFDGMGDLAAINIVPIPRSPQDNDRRTRFVSGFCNTLLTCYDAVLHTDADEMVVADPAYFDDLPGYCTVRPLPSVTAHGFNVVHERGEAPIDPARNILEQRNWVDFSAAMCKPVLTRRPVQWSSGFHRADTPPRFDHLYLFHLRFCDRGIGLRRLARSRAQPWSSPAAGAWQRTTDAAQLDLFDMYDNRPRRPEIAIGKHDPSLRAAVAATLGPARGTPGLPDRFDLNYEVKALWPIPPRFRTSF